MEIDSLNTSHVTAGGAAEREPLHALTATELLALQARGAATPLEIVQACLARIVQREPQVRAWAWHDPQDALQQARALPSGPAGLPLYGVPVGIKDIIDTADMPTEYGSAAYKGYRPGADAEVVRRLRAAGALILGKTVTTEFAYAHPGPTVNPHNAKHTPGGSSSGSAAAVGDLMVPLALGTQTGGSTIRPAAYCGIVGFKPTFGNIPTQGVRPLSPSMDTLGIHARSVADARLLYAVLSGSVPPAVAAAAERAPRIAFCPDFLGDRADADARRVLNQARAALEADGAEVVLQSLPEAWAELGQANRSIMAYEAARENERTYAEVGDRLAPPTKALIEAGRVMPPAQYRQALELVAACRESFEQLMHDFDAILTFSAPGEAPAIEQGTGDSIFNRAWTTLGVPCLTLPYGRGAQGLPLGVQFVGAAGRDYALLDLGERVASLSAA
jgi:Asp-tRNA(Asn)/Glu-tRNA(Gln) amidotransferase A subunit family amidase